MLILGVSGFLGSELYRELYAYFDVYGTYRTPDEDLHNNHKFFEWDFELDSIHLLLSELQPDLIISCLKGNFAGQVYTHFEICEYLEKYNKKLMYISSANVFDAFTNYPSYEYDKTLSESSYGRYKIKIENRLMRLPNHLYNIIRLPMVYGYNSPKIKELKLLLELDEAVEVFPNVVINATTHQKFTQQIHYIINQDLEGIYHLGSRDLIHHKDLIKDIGKALGYDHILFKNVYSSNRDRYIAVLPKTHVLPEHLYISIEDIIYNSVKL
ncbi:sugar nucleotide-binding protein [Psychroflexus salarius]|uniref:sugar nucleotide-binding protein n=1 Tax=Psychroflexus salarius TaxID=1155689 RepID=UPI0009333706